MALTLKYPERIKAISRWFERSEHHRKRGPKPVDPEWGRSIQPNFLVLRPFQGREGNDFFYPEVFATLKPPANRWNPIRGMGSK